MKIDELKFDKSIYPRKRHLGLDEEIKLDVNNVEKCKYYIDLNKKIPGKITYNKRTMNIIDGCHRWQACRELGWKEIPKENLNEVDIEEDAEMWVAAQMNAEQGKTLEPDEIKAIFLHYRDKDGRMIYRSVKEFSKAFNIPIGTLNEWAYKARGGREDSRNNENSTTKNDSGTDTSEDLQQTKKELEKTKIKLDEANKQIKDFEIKWNTICPTHKRAISICKDCGKQ